MNTFKNYWYDVVINLNRLKRFIKRTVRRLYLKVGIKNKTQIFKFRSSFNYNVTLDLSKHVDYRFYLESFENQNFEFLKRILKPDMVIFDIGANIGLYTLFFHEILSESSSIHSFEPAAEAYLRLVQNLKLNRYSTKQLYNFGLSDKTGSITFHICADDAYNSIGTKPMMPVIKTVDITVMSINDFCKEKKIPKIDLIKIDTEGADYLILKGASKFLSSDNAPILLCEYNNLVNEGYAYPINDFLPYLKEKKYHIYQIKKGRLHRFIDNDKRGSFELVCLKGNSLELFGDLITGK